MIKRARASGLSVIKTVSNPYRESSDFWSLFLLSKEKERLNGHRSRITSMDRRINHELLEADAKMREKLDAIAKRAGKPVEPAPPRARGKAFKTRSIKY